MGRVKMSSSRLRMEGNFFYKQMNVPLDRAEMSGTQVSREQISPRKISVPGKEYDREYITEDFTFHYL